MIRLRTKKLLSGVSTLAVLASFSAVDPLLAAETITGPGFVDPVNTAAPGFDLTGVDISGDAIVQTDGSGRSFFNGLGTILSTAGVVIDDSTLQGTFVNAGQITGPTGLQLDNGYSIRAVTNSGTIEGTAGAGIYADVGNWVGGLNNSGTITGTTVGVFIDSGAFVSGGLTNSGSIIGGSTGILIDGGSVTGGITNSGALQGGTYGLQITNGGALAGGLNNSGVIGVTTGGTADTAIAMDNSNWSGGLTNSGTIQGVTYGVNFTDFTFSGGLTNSGLLTVAGPITGTAIYATAGTWSGGITNSGTISGIQNAIFLDADLAFAGGIGNSGLIQGVTNAINIAAGSTFANGINNSGTITATNTAIYIDADSFAGGVTNSGLIEATAGIALYYNSGPATGGVNNLAAGTISATASAIYVNNTTFVGGITNAGLIESTNGIAIYLDTGNNLFDGGINNSGTISGTNTAVYVNNVTFLGGIVNSGIIEGTGGIGIYLDSSNTTFQGGISNTAAGQILGSNSAIYINNVTFLGGITNAGLIESTSDIAIYLDTTNTLFQGGINNSGTIRGTASALYVNNGNFQGGVTNSGLIESTDSIGIYLDTGNDNFTGGISNSASGTILSNETGIYINNVTFDGGITNAGLIDSTSGYGIYIDTGNDSFTGGINNTGTIRGTDTAVYVNNLMFAGGIVNTGLIESDNLGIYVDSSNVNFAGGINNSGIIDADSTAIYIGNDTFTGGITNSGTLVGTTGIGISNTEFHGGINNSGLIDGLTSYGIYISNTTFTGGITNTGTIISRDGGSTGIYISTSNFEGGLNNSGLIRGDSSGIGISVTNWSGGLNNSGTVETLDSDGMSISVSNWTGDFVNSGTILGGTDTVAGNGDGVDLSVTNFGGNFTNSGVIVAGVTSGNGVNMTGTLFNGNVTNSGMIVGRTVGLVLDHSNYGGDVTNSGTILADTTGVQVNGVVAGTFTNSGLIDPSYGLYVDGQILGGITNSGTILASVTAIDLSDADGPHEVRQTGGLIRGNTLDDGTGTVETALDLDNGDDDEFIGSGGVLDGDVIGDGGDDFTVTGPFVYLRGSATDMNQLVVTGGPGAFGVNDADMNGFTDDTPFGGASDEGFALTFNATDMHVNNGGTAYLGDQAQINISNDVNIGGTGTLAFLLTPFSGTHGQVAATGDVNFCDALPACTTNGGNLHAVIDGVLFGQGTTTDTFFYDDVITAANVNNTPTDIDLTTADIDISTSSLFFTAIADVNAGDVDITLTRLDFGDVLLGFIQTQNQQSVGDALEGIWDNGPGFSDQMEDFFALLFNTTDPNEVLFYYDELAGAEHAQLLQTTLGLSSILNNFMEERLDATLLTTGGTKFANLGVAEQRYAQAVAIAANDAGVTTHADGSHGLVRGADGGSLWLRGFGQWANTDADPEAPGYDQDSEGLAGGFDYAVAPNATVGGAVSYATTDVDFDRAGSNADVDSWQVGLYGNYGFGSFYVDGMASYAWHDVASQRVLDLPIPDGPFLAVADYDADTWSIAGEIGGVWPLGRVMMQPSIGVNYVDTSTDGFTETGADAFDLTVTESDADAFNSTLALRAFGRWTMGNTPVLPDVKLGWVHNFNADRHSFTAFLAEDSSVLFPVVSSSINEDAFLFSTGVTAGVTGNIEVFVDVNGLYGSDSSSTNASLGGRFTW